LPTILQPDAVLVRMGDSGQAVYTLDHVRQQNFVLLLHMGDQLHGLRQGLVAFSQLFETLIDASHFQECVVILVQAWSVPSAVA